MDANILVVAFCRVPAWVGEHWVLLWMGVWAYYRARDGTHSLTGADTWLARSLERSPRNHLHIYRSHRRRASEPALSLSLSVWFRLVVVRRSFTHLWRAAAAAAADCNSKHVLITTSWWPHPPAGAATFKVNIVGATSLLIFVFLSFILSLFFFVLISVHHHKGLASQTDGRGLQQRRLTCDQWISA